MEPCGCVLNLSDGDVVRWARICLILFRVLVSAEVIRGFLAADDRTLHFVVQFVAGIFVQSSACCDTSVPPLFFSVCRYVLYRHDDLLGVLEQ